MSKKRIATVLGAVGLAGAAALTMAPAASASATGQNGDVAIWVDGSSTHVNWIRAFASNSNSHTFYGHFQITANGVTLANSSTGYWPNGQGIVLNTNRDFADGTKLCATAWEYNGHWFSDGIACETVER